MRVQRLPLKQDTVYYWTVDSELGEWGRKTGTTRHELFSSACANLFLMLPLQISHTYAFRNLSSQIHADSWCMKLPKLSSGQVNGFWLCHSKIYCFDIRYFGDEGTCHSTEEERTQVFFPLRALLTSQPRRLIKMVSLWRQMNRYGKALPS